jgi:hypothetical protein
VGDMKKAAKGMEGLIKAISGGHRIDSERTGVLAPLLGGGDCPRNNYASTTGHFQRRLSESKESRSGPRDSYSILK